MPYAYEPRPEKVDVVVTFAHPDDETACFGGLLPVLVAAGKSVLPICLTRGEHHSKEAINIRKQELADALWACGIRYDALWGDFRDCGWISGATFETLDWCWNEWGGRAAGRDFMIDIYKRFRPQFVFTLNPETGDYGHPNHMATGWACVDAYDKCLADGTFGDDADGLQKVCVSSKADDAWSLNANEPLDYFAGKTAAEVASAALFCHKSQACHTMGVSGDECFQVYRSQIADDITPPPLW